MSELPAMLVESILKRPNGSVVELGKTKYHFKDDGLDRHVAIVSDPDHLSKLLAIPEGFRLVGMAEPATVIPAEALGIQSAPQAPAAPVKNEAVAAPVAPTIASPTDATTQADPQTDAASPQPIKEDEAPPPSDADPAALEGKTLEELRAIFATEVGRKPSDKAKVDTLIAQIESVRTERAAAAGK